MYTAICIRIIPCTQLVWLEAECHPPDSVMALQVGHNMRMHTKHWQKQNLPWLVESGIGRTH